MVMAACATDAQPHQTSGDDVDPVIDLLGQVGSTEWVQAQREKTQRGQVAPVRAGQKIGRQLPYDKVVVGHVVVQRPDDPVAVGVGKGEAHVHRSGLRVTGGVQPVARPALSEVRRGEQAVHLTLVRGWAGVRGEVLDLLKRGRQAGEAIAQTPQERPWIGPL